jgi:hypothetical protein
MPLAALCAVMDEAYEIGREHGAGLPLPSDNPEGMTSFILFIGSSRLRNGRHRCQESAQCSNSPPATILGLP